MASSSVCNAMSSDSEDSSDDDDDDEGSSSKNDSIRTDRHFSINHDNKKNNKEKIKSKNATRFNFDLKSTQKTMIERMREKERKGKKGSKKNGKIGVRFKEGKEKENGVVEAHCFSKSPVLSTCTSSSTSTTISSTTSSEKGNCDDFSFLFPTHYPTEREGLTRVGSNVRDPSVPAFTSKHLKSPPISSSFFAHGYGSRCVHESGSGTGSGIESDSGSGSAYGRSCERNRGGGGGGGVEGEKGSGSFFEGILESMGEAILTLFTQKVSSSFSS